MQVSRRGTGTGGASSGRPAESTERAAPAHDVGDDARRATASSDAQTTQSPKRTYERLAARRRRPSPRSTRAFEQLGVGVHRAVASMTAVMPEIAACTTGRPVSAARIWPIATCCAEFAERRYERLFVDTTITSAPSRTSGRTW